MNILRPADYRNMPWKNGGGTTTEIMIWPAGASVAVGFGWRISMADVKSGGPFSPFPGCERHLIVINGAGMVLSGIRADNTTLSPLQPVRFSGDATVSATLVDGPLRDYNLITRVGAWEGSLAVFEFDMPTPLTCEEGWVLATILAGSASVSPSPKGPHHTLTKDHSLVLEPGESAVLRPGPSEQVRLTLSRVRPSQPHKPGRSVPAR